MARERILVVDDERGIVSSLRRLLHREGYEVLEAGNGQEAIDAVRAERPDCVIMDVMMPQLDGLTACGLLKYDTSYRDIPVVIMTARGSDSDKRMAKEAGADAFLLKPVRNDELLHTVRTLIELAKPEDEEEPRPAAHHA